MEPVTVKGISKRFGRMTAVEPLTFSIKKGEVLGLIGENGAGKTTTMRMMATILKPSTGEIRINGYCVQKEAMAVRTQIGILFGGDVGMYNRLTARENIAYFGTLYGLAGMELNKRIDTLADMLEMGAFIDRRVGPFSRGMKQKVAIARTLVHDPQVILLDEPTTGLDVSAAVIFRQLITTMREAGKTILFSSHNMGEIEKLCDRVAIMHKGKLLFHGTIPVLRAKSGIHDLDDLFVHLVTGGKPLE